MANKKTAKYARRRVRVLEPAERQFLQDAGALIKQRRFDRGVTADALARQVGITITTQFDREAGKVSMPLENLARYAIALACQPRDLIPDLKPAAFKQPTSDATPSVAPGRKKKPKPKP